MEIFSVGTALFQFLASLMTLLSRFPPRFPLLG